MTGWNWYLGVGWLVGSIGLALLLLFIFGRRVLVRGIPRCIACGYRLDGGPADGSARCPECGRTPRSPAEPYAMGRKKWIGLLGITLIAGGFTLAAVPTARTQGWAALLPIGVQVRLLELSDDADLWYHVSWRASQGRAAARMESPLRRRILARLLDADGDAAPAIKAMAALGLRSNLSGPMLTDDDFERILAEGSSAARSFAMSQLGRTPPSPDLVALRRIAWVDADEAQRRMLLDWLVQHPADTGDLGLIRAALEDGDWGIAMAVGQEISKAPPEVALAIAELFRHDDARVRGNAVYCFRNWMGDRDSKPPIEIQRAILAMLDDPDARTRDIAGGMIDDMSPEMVDAIGRRILHVNDRHRFRLVIEGAVRNRDPGLVPYLEEAALQPHRPLSQRLHLAETHYQVRARADLTPEEPRLAELYREAAASLAAGDPATLIVIASELPWGPQPLLLLAIADAAAADGVRAEGLNAWFAARPPYGALLDAAVPEADEHAAAFATLLRSVSDRKSHMDTMNAIAEHIERWFPTAEPPGETGG